jgi:chromosome segregation ATPase
MDNINIIFNKLGSIEASLDEIKASTKVNTEDIRQLKEKINELQSSIDFIYGIKKDRIKKEEIEMKWLLVFASFINIGISVTIFLLSRFI